MPIRRSIPAEMGGPTSSLSSGTRPTRKRKHRVVKDQSTLTQLNGVIFPHGRREPETTGISSDDEVYEQPLPKKRQRIARDRSRKSDTLTQRHGFVRSASNLSRQDSEDEVQVQVHEARPKESAKARVASMKRRNQRMKIENMAVAGLIPGEQDMDTTMNGLEQELEVPNSSQQPFPHPDGIADQQISGFPSPAQVYRTPRKSVRFAAERIIPSSQTPSEAGLSTQRSRRYKDVQCSPLKERNGNTMLSTFGRRRTPQKIDTTEPRDDSGYGTMLLDDENAASAEHGAVNPALLLTVKPRRDLEALTEAQFRDGRTPKLSHICNSNGEFDADESQFERILRDIDPAMQDVQSPESQPIARKMLERTRRRLALTLPLNDKVLDVPPPSSARVGARVQHYEQPDFPHITHPGPMQRTLKRTHTVQDSQGEVVDPDDFGPELASVYDTASEGGDNLTYTNDEPSTYDPVHSALDRDAARFLWSQQFPIEKNPTYRLHTQPPRPPRLLSKTTVEDSDQDEEDLLVTEEGTTDDEVVTVSEKVALPELGERTTGAVHDVTGNTMESQCTHNAGGALLEVIGALQSKSQSQALMRGRCCKKEINERDCSKSIERPGKESSKAKLESQVRDFALHPASMHDQVAGQEVSLMFDHAGSSPQPYRSMMEEDVEVVLSSQPTERRYTSQRKRTQHHSEATRIPSSPPVLRQSQISTVVPTQCSQYRLLATQLPVCSTALLPTIATWPQTMSSSPIPYPCMSPVDGQLSLSKSQLPSSERHDTDADGALPPLALTDFSLLPPPEWQSETMMMSSSPITLPPDFSSRLAKHDHGKAGSEDGSIPQTQDLVDFSLPPPPPMPRSSGVSSSMSGR